MCPGRKVSPAWERENIEVEIKNLRTDIPVYTLLICSLNEESRTLLFDRQLDIYHLSFSCNPILYNVMQWRGWQLCLLSLLSAATSFIFLHGDSESWVAACCSGGLLRGEREEPQGFYYSEPETSESHYVSSTTSSKHFIHSNIRIVYVSVSKTKFSIWIITEHNSQ